MVISVSIREFLEKCMPSGGRPWDHVITYCSVVTRKCVCITFIMAMAYDLEVKAEDEMLM